MARRARARSPRPTGPGPSSPVSPGLCAWHDAGQCRSCPHLPTPLDLQLAAKQEKVAALLAAGPSPVPRSAWAPPASSAPTGFRNKAKMVVAGTTGRPTLGILDATGRGVDLRSCPLHARELQAALPVLASLIGSLGLIPYDVPARRGELKHLLVTASPDGDLMVRFVLRSRRHLRTLREALPQLHQRLPQLAVASVNIQPVHQAVIEGEEEIVLTASDRLLMRLHLPGRHPAPSGPPPGPARSAPALSVTTPMKAGPEHGAGRPVQLVNGELLLHLPTRSFFQTNTAVAQALYATARAWAQEGVGAEGSPARAPRRVWDLFCGVGGFALSLAAPGRTILGVEVSTSAIDGARQSVTLMGLDPDLVRFEAGNARLLDPGAADPPDLLVVNPPRRGIGAELAGRIEASGIRRVLYSSCNPVSLAQDLARMPSLRARRARLFDMFPHTDHAEVLVELVR
ncbi:methyltransferase domain-containing protein [Actinomyces oricola]|uniref:methyltransferase domain-containing protein n=1 Tax=Actinomyces oricola TaxID=206043 RepID=UPI000FFE75AB|nr:methyltransferase domain-containing protein [Actinomyces oricola]